MTIHEQIAVMQHVAKGGSVQWRSRSNGKDGGWLDYYYGAPRWDWNSLEYRIKPEPPKPRSFWIVEWATPSGGTWTRVRVCPSRESAQHTLYSCWNRNADPRRAYRAVELREVLP
jgi:hypothetical protein